MASDLCFYILTLPGCVWETLVTCPDEKGLHKAGWAVHDACEGFPPALHWDDSDMSPGSQEMLSHLCLFREDTEEFMPSPLKVKYHGI